MNEEHTMKQRELTQQRAKLAHQRHILRAGSRRSLLSTPVGVSRLVLLLRHYLLTAYLVPLTPSGTDIHQSFIPNLICASSFTLHEEIATIHTTGTTEAQILSS